MLKWVLLTLKKNSFLFSDWMCCFSEKGKCFWNEVVLWRGKSKGWLRWKSELWMLLDKARYVLMLVKSWYQSYLLLMSISSHWCWHLLVASLLVCSMIAPNHFECKMNGSNNSNDFQLLLYYTKFNCTCHRGWHLLFKCETFEFKISFPFKMKHQ